MDTVLVPHITVAYTQKVKTVIKWRKYVITHWEDVHMGSPRIFEVEESIVTI